MPETWRFALLESVASKPVCGKVWLNNRYVSNLAPEDQNKVSYHNSDHIYQIGDNQRIQALQRANIEQTLQLT